MNDERIEELIDKHWTRHGMTTKQLRACIREALEQAQAVPVALDIFRAHRDRLRARLAEAQEREMELQEALRGWQSEYNELEAGNQSLIERLRGMRMDAERQQTPCHHEFGPRPVHDLPAAPSEAVCVKCGYKPTATDGGHS